MLKNARRATVAALREAQAAAARSIKK